MRNDSHSAAEVGALATLLWGDQGTDGYSVVSWLDVSAIKRELVRRPGLATTFRGIVDSVHARLEPGSSPPVLVLTDDEVRVVFQRDGLITEILVVRTE